MTQSERERYYIQGHRAAWRRLLGECLRELGYTIDTAVSVARFVGEREDAIAQLRTLCEEVGDNDWEESLLLGDIIEKHLARHLL